MQVNTTGNNPNLGTSLETLSGYSTGAKMKYRATVTATDDAGNSATQIIVVRVSDVGGADDDTATGTGTGTGTGTVDNVAPVFTSPDTYTVNEGVTAIGTVTAFDYGEVTYTIGDTTSPVQLAGVKPVLQITLAGVLSFSSAPDFDVQVPDALQTDSFTNTYSASGATVFVSKETLSAYQTGATDGFRSKSYGY